MAAPRELHFEWNLAKALSDEQKHGIAFTLAASVFRDARIQVIFDEEHSVSEERWVALGAAVDGSVLVVIHTWLELDPVNVKVRIISARRATATEELAYARGQYG